MIDLLPYNGFTSGDSGPVYDKGAKDRVRRWRDNNREAYNERQREYMRAYRKRKAG